MVTVEHDPDNVDEVAVAAAYEVLVVHHPQVRRDASGAVATAGFFCVPGVPGSGAVRVGHRCPLPSVASGRTFREVAAEEFVYTSTYGDLLRDAGWTVRDVTTTRPCLLAHRSDRSLPEGRVSHRAAAPSQRSLPSAP